MASHPLESTPPAQIEPAVVGENVREISLEEALSVVVLLQRQHRTEDAERLCRTLLEAFPDHPDALHFLALSVHQRGQHAEAVRIIEGILARYPDHAHAWSNLGIFRKTAGSLDEAAEAFERAIAIDARHVNAWSNLGTVRRAQKRLEESENAYRKALEIDPGHAGAWHNLAALLEARGLIQEAVVAYSHACVHDPANGQSKRMLAHAYWTVGETDRAVEVVRSWLKEQPADPVATHLLAAYSGCDVPARASDACVELMFDSFATTFESKLRHLHYRAPELILSVLKDKLPRADASLRIMDAGCGTGLCGTLLAPYARTLSGVDLSAGMLERARARGIYHELVKAEITAYLEQHPRAFDVIVSADTLVYFGDLTGVLAAMSLALEAGGTVAFTLEKAAAPPECNYVLEAHGRYSHTESYVTATLERLGLSVEVHEAELRMESGRPVAGLVVVAAQPRLQ